MPLSKKVVIGQIGHLKKRKLLTFVNVFYIKHNFSSYQFAEDVRREIQWRYSLERTGSERGVLNLVCEKKYEHETNVLKMAIKHVLGVMAF